MSFSSALLTGVAAPKAMAEISANVKGIGIMCESFIELGFVSNIIHSLAHHRDTETQRKVRGYWYLGDDEEV